MSENETIAGNAAAMREALESVLHYLPHMLLYMRVHWEDANAGGYYERIKSVAEAALSAPPRNCDVGTAEEQGERFRKFCNRENNSDCLWCPLLPNWAHNCSIAWTQMPYEEGGDK